MISLGNSKKFANTVKITKIHQQIINEFIKLKIKHKRMERL